MPFGLPHSIPQHLSPSLPCLIHNLNLSKHVFFIKKLYDLLLLVSYVPHTQKYLPERFESTSRHFFIHFYTTLNIYLSYYYIPVPKVQIKHFENCKSSQFIFVSEFHLEHFELFKTFSERSEN